ncbi:MAG: MYXO-CTERM sorting domain-containing protein [Enhygromyxa sp.]
MRRLLATSLLALAFVPAALVLHPSEASACSCMPPPGPVESAQNVDVVFHGKLLAVTIAPKPDQYGITNKIYTFEILRTFKGQLDAQINVTTADNDAACGRNYGPVGSEWLIYGRGDEGGLHDNLCSRSRPIAHASEDIAELLAHADELDDDPPPPQPPPEDEPELSDPDPEPILPDMDTSEEPEPTPKPRRCSVTDDTPAGGLGGLLALGLGLAALRRRR